MIPLQHQRRDQLRRFLRGLACQRPSNFAGSSTAGVILAGPAHVDAQRKQLLERFDLWCHLQKMQQLDI